MIQYLFFPTKFACSQSSSRRIENRIAKKTCVKILMSSLLNFVWISFYKIVYMIVWKFHINSHTTYRLEILEYLFHLPQVKLSVDDDERECHLPSPVQIIEASLKRKYVEKSFFMLFWSWLCKVSENHVSDFRGDDTRFHQNSNVQCCCEASTPSFIPEKDENMKQIACVKIDSI